MFAELSEVASMEFTVAQPFKRFPFLSGTRMFITNLKLKHYAVFYIVFCCVLGNLQRSEKQSLISNATTRLRPVTNMNLTRPTVQNFNQIRLIVPEIEHADKRRDSSIV
jgi:hypothetical protein